MGHGSLQHHGEYALGIARHFGQLDLSAATATERAVYFRLGPLSIHYPATWALPLAILAALLFAAALSRGRSTPERAGGHAFVFGLRLVAAGLLATLLGTLGWIALTALRARPGVLEGYVELSGILLLSAWVAAKAAGRAGAVQRAVVPGLVVLLALATSVWLPGASYLFTWPAVAACAALLVPLRRASWARTVVVAAVTALVMTPPIAIFFQFAQPRPGNPGSEVRAAMAMPLLLALLSLALLRAVQPRGSAPASTSAG